MTKQVKNVDDLKFNEEGTCPLCGSRMITYVETNSDGGAMWYECTCDECEASWQEVYEVTFNQVDEVFDAEGNKIYSSFN